MKKEVIILVDCYLDNKKYSIIISKFMYMYLECYKL